jgi:hypothetical protein
MKYAPHTIIDVDRPSNHNLSAIRPPTQNDEEQWWRELQLAASASAGVRAATFGMFHLFAIATTWQAG